jgi:hypothetical protein
MPYKRRMILVTTKVNEDKYQQFRAAAGDKTVAEWVREVLDVELERRPFELQLMEQLWALRYVLLNTLPFIAPQPSVVTDVTRKLIDEAERKKTSRAVAILEARQ